MYSVLFRLNFATNPDKEKKDNTNRIYSVKNVYVGCILRKMSYIRGIYIVEKDKENTETFVILCSISLKTFL